MFNYFGKRQNTYRGLLESSQSCSCYAQNVQSETGLTVSVGFVILAPKTRFLTVVPPNHYLQ